MPEINHVEVPRPQLDLPFKPFTFDEVKRITGVPANILDFWVNRLWVQKGQGVMGLEWMQTFGVFCGWRYLQEGAPQSRALGIMQVVGQQMSRQAVDALIESGSTFICTPDMGKDIPKRGVATKPPDSRLGKALNLKVLLAEFEDAILKVFPAKLTQSKIV